MHKTVAVTERTIWQAKCDTCGDSKELTEHTKREHYCFACKKWVPYVKLTYVGAELGRPA